MGEGKKAKTWIKTSKPGIYRRENAEGEAVLFAAYRREGKPVMAKVGIVGYPVPEEWREIVPDAEKLTVPVAADIRAHLKRGKAETRQERRGREEAERQAQEGRMTVAKIWEAWLEDGENRDLPGNEKASYRFDKHLKEPFGDKEPAEITEWEVTAFRTSLAKKYAAETTKSILSLLSRIINYGHDKKYCMKLPFNVLPSRRERKKKLILGREPRPKRSPSPEEIASFLTACAEWPDRQAADMMLFMVYTGCRRGSAWTLRWSEVDLDAATAVLMTKTGTKRIPLSAECVEMLRRHPKTYDEKGEEIGYVFTGTGEDGQLSLGQVQRFPRKIADAAKWSKELDPSHSWRRNLATKLDAAGVSTKTIMALGGWSTSTMVLHYTKTEDATVAAASATLGKIINGAVNGGAE